MCPHFRKPHERVDSHHKYLHYIVNGSMGKGASMRLEHIHLLDSRAVHHHLRPLRLLRLRLLVKQKI